MRIREARSEQPRRHRGKPFEQTCRWGSVPTFTIENLARHVSLRSKDVLIIRHGNRYTVICLLALPNVFNSLSRPFAIVPVIGEHASVRRHGTRYSRSKTLGSQLDRALVRRRATALALDDQRPRWNQPKSTGNKAPISGAGHR